MPSMLQPLLMLLLVLALVPLALWCWRRVQRLAPAPAGLPLSVLAQLPLGPRERIVVVQAGAQVLIVGCSAQQITLLSQLSAESLAVAPVADAAAPGAGSPAAGPVDFSRLLAGLARLPLSRRP